MSKTARRVASVPQDAWLDELIDQEGPTFKAAVDAAVAELHLEQDLIRLREREGLSQRDVAQRLGVTQPVVARLEAGAASAWKSAWWRSTRQPSATGCA